MTLALSMIGIGTAAWQDGIGILGVISTGDIDPVFIDFYEADGINDAVCISISDDRKTVSISMEEVCPGDTMVFNYTVANKGSVPVRLKLATLGNQNDSAITIANEFPADSFIDGLGDSVSGRLTISVNDEMEELLENTTYTFGLELLFQQWNITF